MAYSRELPTKEGYYWVRGMCEKDRVETIVHVDRTKKGLMVKIPSSCIPFYTRIEKHVGYEWSGPIDRPIHKECPFHSHA